MQPLRDATDARHDGAALRELLDQDSYVFLPGLIDRATVAEVRAAILGVLETQGWLRAGEPLDAAVPSEKAEPERSGSDNFLAAYAGIQSIQSFHELAIQPALIDVLSRIFDTPVLTHPMKIARLGVPTPELWTTPTHQDFQIIQGTADFVTAWVPLCDCTEELGGLRVLRGSHRTGARPVFAAAGVGGVGVAESPVDQGWASADFQMGDVLIFHSLTAHGALPNRTERIRLSGDFRYQSVGSPLREAMLNPHYHPLIPDYDVLARDWTSRRSIEVPPDTVVVPNTETAEDDSALVTLDQRGR